MIETVKAREKQFVILPPLPTGRGGRMRLCVQEDGRTREVAETPDVESAYAFMADLYERVRRERGRGRVVFCSSAVCGRMSRND